MVASLPRLARLSLALRGRGGFYEPLSLAGATALSALELSGCRSLPLALSLSELTGLERLALSGCGEAVSANVLVQVRGRGAARVGDAAAPAAAVAARCWQIPSTRSGGGGGGRLSRSLPHAELASHACLSLPWPGCPLNTKAEGVRAKEHGAEPGATGPHCPRPRLPGRLPAWAPFTGHVPAPARAWAAR
jgi:hypothetical protein